jgi:uncharacterized SAM-binding protein YcdF (DUF218 family)
MGFLLGKLFWAIAAPGNLLLLLMCLGALRLQTSRRRRGFRLVAVPLALLLAVAALPIGQWLVMPLEARFPQPTLPPHVDGIIVLGGAVDAAVSRAHGQVALNAAAERLIESLRLARRYPTAKLLLSGGEATILPRGDSEADTMRAFFVEQGVDPARLILEDRSRDTYENAVFSRDLVAPPREAVWILVTSAMHMPRAVGCFRAVDWEVIPYPVDYRAEAEPRPYFHLSDHLDLVDTGAKEWIGLLAYRLLGHTEELFPAP